MAPSVANAASSIRSPAGTGANRFAGTEMISAWWAYCAPAQATGVPTGICTASPRSTITPDAE
jgi:hypothetical protein